MSKNSKQSAAMNIKRKNKVHPAPSSSSSSAAAVAAIPSSPYMDYSGVLNRLPPEILSLLDPLTVGDFEVLAFMMKNSMPSKKRSKRFWKKPGSPRARPDDACLHAPPRFKCFYCYASYMERWSSSPNWELIQRAVEAFDDQFVPIIPPLLPEVLGSPIDETAAVGVQSPAPRNGRGLARRVWPDVLGLFNSRLWRFWGPN